MYLVRLNGDDSHAPASTFVTFAKYARRGYIKTPTGFQVASLWGKPLSRSNLTREEAVNKILAMERKARERKRSA